MLHLTLRNVEVKPFYSAACHDESCTCALPPFRNGDHSRPAAQRWRGNYHVHRGKHDAVVTLAFFEFCVVSVKLYESSGRILQARSNPESMAIDSGFVLSGSLSSASATFTGFE